MSLFEWFGESYNPGNVGDVRVGGLGRGSRSRARVLVCFATASLLVGAWLYVMWAKLELRTVGDLSVGVGLTLLYLLLAFVIHPKPDYSNIGWLGGLVDHPFRYSDDINRTLILLLILLWPGRFVSKSMADMILLLVNARSKTR